MNGEKNEPVEFEMLAEAHIVGEVTHADFTFMVWEFGNKSPGEKRRLCLRLAGGFQKIDNDTLNQIAKSATKRGPYTNLGMANEIIVLSSLFLRRRFSWPILIRVGNNPMMMPSDFYDPCQELRGQYSNLGDLKEWFGLWDKTTDDVFRHDYLRAARLYYFACNLMDKDVGAAYLIFTSAIETLSGKYVLKEPAKLGEINPELDKCIDDVIKDLDVAEKLRAAALKGAKNTKKKFVEFAMSNIADAFWEEGTGPLHSRVKKEEISQVLKNIYDQRSLTLHDGVPFPIYIYEMCPKDRGEIRTAPTMVTEGRRWERNDYIPYIHFMERLVSHVLHHYFQRYALECSVKEGG